MIRGDEMALYVVQHGKSLPKTEDPDKGVQNPVIRWALMPNIGG
jgi:hypothetical protein